MKNAEKHIYRIIDANFNRSREGLRVCEEIARFAIGSKELTEELKSVRHRISTIKKDTGSGPIELICSRDVAGDVGRDSNIRARTRRADLGDIFSANMQRTKESIRVLEEFFKLIDEDISRRFSRLRFKVYDIEQSSAKRLGSLKK
jgi:thiamine-phosphate pyrophosphorylase